MVPIGTSDVDIELLVVFAVLEFERNIAMPVCPLFLAREASQLRSIICVGDDRERCDVLGG